MNCDIDIIHGWAVLGQDEHFKSEVAKHGHIMLEEAIASLAVVQELGPRDTVIDVGAFIGDSALIFAKNGAVVHAFEPQFDAYLCALHNTRHRSAIKVYGEPLGNGTEGMAFASQETVGGNPGTRAIKVDPAGNIAIRCIDDFRLAPTFIKIDVEGFEENVVAGAAQTILHHKPAMLIEVYPEMMAKHGLTEQGLYSILRALDYQWEVCIGDDWEPRWDILATPK